MKQTYLYAAFAVSLVVISVMGTYIVMDSKAAKPQPMPSAIPTNEPTQVPTQEPTIEPTAVPVKKVNTAVQQRLASLDKQIADIEGRLTLLKTENKKYEDAGPDTKDLPPALDPMIIIRDYYAVVEHGRKLEKEMQAKIDTLNAERTQILINM